VLADIDKDAVGAVCLSLMTSFGWVGSKAAAVASPAVARSKPCGVLKLVPRVLTCSSEVVGWVRTVRAECTDRMLIAGPRNLRAVLDEYVAHYNHHRPHRARNLRPPDTDDIVTAPVTDLATARIRCRNILGGLIHEYERAA
jgi:putative transposase